MKREEGQTIIEFALIAIMFFMVFFGIIEFSFLMYNQQVVANAAREGARFGIVSRPDANKILVGDIENKAREYAENNLVSFGDKNFVPQATIEPSAPSCTHFQDKLTVDVRYDYSFLFLPFVKKTLGSTAIMFCE